MHRIILADCHPAVRMGVKLTVEGCGRYTVVSEASNIRELMLAIEEERPDIVITDMSMDRGDSRDGLAMIRHITRRYPKISLLVLTVSCTGVMIKSLVEIGVSAVVSKCDNVDELLEGLYHHARTGTFISKYIRSTTFDERGSQERKGLTRSEAEVLRQLADDLSVTAIAKRSSRSVATISKQKASAMKKLKINGSAQFYTYLSHIRAGSRVSDV